MNIRWSCELLPGIYVIRAEVISDAKYVWKHRIIHRRQWELANNQRAMLASTIRDLDQSVKAAANT